MAGYGFILSLLALMQINGISTEDILVDSKDNEEHRLKRYIDIDQVLMPASGNGKENTTEINEIINATIPNQEKITLALKSKLVPKKKLHPSKHKYVDDINKGPNNYHDEIKEMKPKSVQVDPSYTVYESPLKVKIDLDDVHEITTKKVPECKQAESNIITAIYEEPVEINEPFRNRKVSDAKYKTTSDLKQRSENENIKKIEINVHKYEEHIFRTDPKRYCFQPDTKSHWDVSQDSKSEFNYDPYIQVNPYERRRNSYERTYYPEYPITSYDDKDCGSVYYDNIIGKYSDSQNEIQSNANEVKNNYFTVI